MSGRKTSQRLPREIADGLLRSWWTVVAGVCLGLSVSLVILQFTPHVYSAAARLHLDAVRLADGSVKDTVLVDSELRLKELRRIVTSDRYLDLIISEMFEDPTDPEERRMLAHRLRSGVSVDTPRRADSFMIGYRDVDRARAAAIANRLAEFYLEEHLEYRVNRASETVDAEQKGRDSRFEIVSAAVPPTTPVYPRPLLFYGTGVGFGLLLFVGPVICRRVLVPAINSESQLLEIADVPVLIVFPSFPTPAASRRARGILRKNVVLSVLAATVLIAVYSAQRLDWL